MNTTTAYTTSLNVNSKGRFTVSTTAYYQVTIRIGVVQFGAVNGRLGIALCNADTGAAPNNSVLASGNIGTNIVESESSTFVDELNAGVIY